MAEARGKQPIDGYTPSAWKSLAVKSLRMGWPEGVRQAGLRLSPSTVRGIMLAQVFEDIWPAESELADVMDEIKRGDWAALCARDTLHGRGYTDQYLEPGLGEEADSAAMDPVASGMAEKARGLGLWMPPRAWSNFYVWLKVAPGDAGAKRPVDGAPWRGMPLAMLDNHTSEGWKRFHGRQTVLSGTSAGHRELGRLVEQHGWEAVRDIVHGDIDRPKKEKLLTPVQRAIERNKRKKEKRG